MSNYAKEMCNACEHGDIKKVKEIYKKSKTVNLLYNQKYPLSIACLKNDTPLVEYLLKIGANPNLRFCGDVEYIPGAFGSIWRPIFNHVCYYSDYNILKLLLNNGADPNGRGHAGNTPLAATAYSRSKKINKLLLDYGALPNMVIRPESSWTPMKEAELNNKSLVPLFKKYPRSGSSEGKEDKDIVATLDFTPWAVFAYFVPCYLMTFMFMFMIVWSIGCCFYDLLIN